MNITISSISGNKFDSNFLEFLHIWVSLIKYYGILYYYTPEPGLEMRLHGKNTATKIVWPGSARLQTRRGELELLYEGLPGWAHGLIGERQT